MHVDKDALKKAFHVLDAVRRVDPGNTEMLWKFAEIKIMRSSLCGSSEAGAEFLLNKEFNTKNLQNFALSVCHECRAPRFGHTCAKEVAGINHLVSLIDALSLENFYENDENLRLFIENTRAEYSKRLNNSRLLLNEVIFNE